MESNPHEEHEVRAARNQALFRALNENLKSLNEAFASLTETFAIACECADRNCIQMIEIAPDAYLAVRADPRHFAVASGHVEPGVEVIVRESTGYVVVEKTAKAGEVAEALEQTTNPKPEGE